MKIRVNFVNTSSRKIELTLIKDFNQYFSAHPNLAEAKAAVIAGEHWRGGGVTGSYLSIQKI